ncbi:protease complex subunit PrcB family protein [Clostridium sp. MCC353]|nr:protease complex subunit PrcB family protein [Clostridium sp. MCC353]
MKKTLSMKAVILVSMILWVLMARFLGGCSASKDDGGKVRDLEFTVMSETEIPEELQKIITEKMAQSFKLTYSDDQNLYIVVGYGQQPTGGYSIAVKELYLTDNSIVIDTELTGPGKGENTGNEPSYPYIVVKTEFLENPVIFQ